MKRKVSIEWNAEHSPPQNARKHLPALVREWFSAGRKSAQEGRSPREFHQFRLATKRLRYTLELFKTIYGRGLVARLKSLSEVQDLLGMANDYHVTALALRERMRFDPALQPVFELLEKRAAEKRGEFRIHWVRMYAPALVEARWVNYFRRNAGGRKPWPRPAP